MSISVIGYSEVPSARSISLDASGYRTLTRSWIARLDVSAAVDADWTLLDKFVEVNTPVTWYEAHPARPAARANQFKASPINGDMSEWLCQVTYSSDLKRLQRALGDGQGGSTGSATPATSQDAQTDAASRPPKIEIVRVQYEKIVEVDAISGVRITNTAGDPFDPPLTVEASRMAFKINFIRTAAWSTNFVTYFNYNDKVNAAAFSLGGSSFPAKTLRCVIENINPTWEVQTVSSVQQLSFHWDITIHLEYEPATWQRKILSTGKREIVSGKYRNITGADGSQVTEPVALKFDGTKAAAGDGPIYVTNDTYNTISFTSLLA